jgi:exodeoxyribonuclease VII large subunit
MMQTTLFHDQQPIFTVSSLTSVIKEILERTFTEITLEGEISNFRPASSGHWYFTLKDHSAQISAVMFRNRQNQISFRPRDGQQVAVRGTLSVYEKRGTYQIICSSIRAAGEGAILAMLEERKRRLAAEGLFDSGRKKPLPLLPERIAVITSPTGAALRDILQVLSRRNAGALVRVIPATVQGEEAPSTLCRALEAVNAHDLGDVIIIGRGGGSLEDLLPFSDERVVRAVAASRIPVLSAVGHETDSSLCDLAADMRAPTPSAAAELVSAGRKELLDRIVSGRRYISTVIEGRMSRIRLLLQPFSPERMVETYRKLVEPAFMRIDEARDSLERSCRDLLAGARHRLSLQRSLLESVSPKAVLQRGYALVTELQSHRVIRHASELAHGQRIAIQFSDDSAEALIERENESNG